VVQQTFKCVYDNNNNNNHHPKEKVMKRRRKGKFHAWQTIWSLHKLVLRVLLDAMQRASGLISLNHDAEAAARPSSPRDNWAQK
jgi:hypothetical protein